MKAKTNNTAAAATASHSKTNPTATYTVSVRRYDGMEKSATAAGFDPVNCRCTILPRLSTYSTAQLIIYVCMYVGMYVCMYVCMYVLRKYDA